MALQIDLLEKARTTGGGRIQARCPACAESGGDTKAQHLVVYPDGRFGCCLYPGDKQHRKQIFALVGRKKSLPVITARPPPRTVIQSIRVEMTPMKLPVPLTQPDPDPELPVPELKSGISSPLIGTLGTPFSNPRGYSGQKSITYAPYLHEGQSLPVPGVPDVPKPSDGKDLDSPVPSVPNRSPKPNIDTHGNLRIPFDSPERLHWWKGGQSVAETLREVGTSEAAFAGIGPAKESIPDLRQTGERETVLAFEKTPHTPTGATTGSS